MARNWPTGSPEPHEDAQALKVDSSTSPNIVDETLSYFINDSSGASMRQSELYCKPGRDASKEEVSINAQLLTRAGYVDRLMAGVYSYLPLGQRVLSKIEAIVREEMAKVEGQEIFMPALHPREVWDRTGRWDSMDILFRLKGANDRDLALGPTHEEVVTPLIGSGIKSYRDLPISVYQIQTKYRNEARPKSGLLRGREFRMKDMYSFHATQEDLDRYYERVQGAYKAVFERCGLGPFTFLTFASGGAFSKYSHEYQTITPHGEDYLYLAREKGIAVNREIIDEVRLSPEWKDVEFEEHKAIEVGNIFKLGTRFSDAFSLSYQGQEGSKHSIVMGCYGLGTTRLLGSVVEVLHDKNGIVWPTEIAPFRIHLISLVKSEVDRSKVDALYNFLRCCGAEVLYDDRQVSAGDKFVTSDLLGIPLRMVISPKTLTTDSVELKKRNEDTIQLVPIEALKADPCKCSSRSCKSVT